MSETKRQPPIRMSLLKWHRWLTLVLSVQLLIWLITALGMASVPRSATTAYRVTPPTLEAASAWPELAALQAAAPEAAAISIAQSGMEPELKIDPVARDEESKRLLARSLRSEGEISAAEIAAYASSAINENITTDQVSLKTRNSPEYQKRPTPALRVEASKAVLFFDPVTGELLEQTTWAHRLENWFKTIHVMDYTGNAQFRQNVVLTFFAAVFFCAAILGAAPVRRFYMAHKGGLRSLRWHQVLGLALLIQVFFWVTSGLGVVWFLHPLRDEAHATMAQARAPIAWSRVNLHPRDIDFDIDGEPETITLTMLLGEPVYQAKWPGRGAPQSLRSARDGREILLGESERDRILESHLGAQSASTVREWRVAESPADLDYFFYTGPYPVWKGYFDDPVKGVVAIDQVTGHVHTPRTSREVGLEKYYKVHVVDWTDGIIKYRQSPILIAVILITFVLLITGGLMHMRRWRRQSRRK